MKLLLAAALFLSLAVTSSAQEEAADPAELAILQATVGTWDCHIKVWPQGPDAEALEFKGVETNRASGKHWIVSEFESEFAGQKMRVHSLVGYDIDKKALVGNMVDEGPYAATMTGKYDEKTKTIAWVTKGKMPNGEPLVQNTKVTYKDGERHLTMIMGGKKFMEIRYVKRK